MSQFTKTAKSILAVIAVADMSAFSDLTSLTLVSIILGSAVIILGLQFSIKFASIVGLLIVGVAAASSMNMVTVLEVAPLIGAITGLLIPMMLLLGICLTADDETDQAAEVGRKQLAIAIAFAGMVLASAPIVSLVLSFALPTVTMRFTAVTEIAIMMVFLIGGGIILTRESREKKTAVTVVRPDNA